MTRDSHARRTRAGLAAVLACLVAMAGTAAAEPVEPTHGGVYMVGTEFALPCLNSPFPWNSPSTVGIGQYGSYDEVNEWTVLGFDSDGDGFQYEPDGSDDRWFYTGGPQVGYGYDWADEYDTADCWLRNNPPLTVFPAGTDDIPHHNEQSGDDGAGPGGEPPPQPNPRPDEPILADPDAADGTGFLGEGSVVGTWRYERWRETSHWYYDHEGGNCGGPDDRDKECWFNQNIDDISLPDSDYVMLDRRDFQVSDPAVFITSGPSGRVGSPAATFEFVWVSDQEQPGRYECALDGEEFSACESPKDYTGLDDGSHTFEVRYVLDGQDPDEATITERQWVVDTTPPDTIIESRPPPSTDSPSATVSFISTEPDNATYRCRLDGGEEYDCSSPEQLSGLGEGAHTFEVKSIDRVGNEQAGWTAVTWTVVPPPPGSVGGGGGGGGAAGGGGSRPPATVAPPAATAGCKAGKVDGGILVAVAREGACFSERKVGEDHVRYTVRGATTINGILVTPGPLTDTVVDVEKSETTLELKGPATFELGPIKLPVLTGFKRSFERNAQSDSYALPYAGDAQKKLFGLAGLPISAAPSFELGTGSGGSSKANLVVEAPSAFRGVAGGKVDDDAPGGLTAEFGFSASNDEGVKLNAKATIAKAWLFGKASLEDVNLGVAYPPLALEGSASLVFPGAPGGSGSKWTLSTAWAAEPPGPFFNITKLGLQASNIEKPIGYGFFLQRVGGEFNRCTDASGGGIGGAFSANGGASFGPEFDLAVWKGEAISLDGRVALSLCEPKSVEVSGDAKLVGIPLANASLSYRFDGMAKLKALYDISAGPVGYKAGITDAWLTSKAFNVESTGQVRLGGLSAQGNGVISSDGWAVCYGALGRSVGFTQRWGQAVQPFSSGCDVGPLRRAAPALARAAQAGGGQPFDVRPGAPLHVVAVRGDAGVPAVTLTGPDGATVAVPADGATLQTPSALVVPDPDAKTAYFVLYSPAAGRWTASGPTPFRLETAERLPAPRVEARVTGRGARRVLSWSLTAIPGQSVTLYERGENAARKLVTTTRPLGRIAFRPTNVPGRPRTIEAVVTQDGVPRATLAAGRFTAPAFVKPARVRGLTLRGRKVRWKAQRGAARYTLVLRLPSGRTRVFETRRPHVPYAGRRVQVTISALGADGTPGPVVTRTLRAKRRRR